MKSQNFKLDNPAWFSLSEAQTGFAIDYNNVKFYNPDYCSFGGFEKATDVSECIDKYSLLTNDFFVVGQRPELSNRLTIKKEIVSLQMIIDDKIDFEITEDIILLTAAHADSLYNLVTSIQPGYSKEKTALLGNYFGIFKNGELVAAAGERMKMNGFIEVSAVVTHPDYSGNGYAKQLIAKVVNNIFHQNNIPYLHVAETNSVAIRLYEKLGFKTRRKMSFWNVTGNPLTL